MGKKDMEVLEARIAEGEAREAAARKKEMKEKLKKKKKSFFADFKKFITKGNIVDMAVGVIVGSAFTAIITALSNGILKPVINFILAKILGKDSLSEVYTFLQKAYKTGEAGEQVVDLANSIYIDWGAFINAIINFLLVAFTLFVIARIARNIMNRAKARELEAAKAAEEKKKAEEKAKAEAAAALAAEKEAQLQAFYANVARQTELLEQLSKK
ncbi:MAG: large conductance mechanosensitive channel protein MscL [Clostridia bacterium]|nr:large conductance mechanosensitive channel protein MscL [Clostridia bacterium]